MVKRVRKQEVTWYEADSTEDLARQLRHAIPDPKGAYGIHYTGLPQARRFVFGGVVFRALWRSAAERGFSSTGVRRLFLSGSAAVSVAPGTRPRVPAYVPESGDVWIAIGGRSPHGRRAPGRAESQESSFPPEVDALQGRGVPTEVGAPARQREEEPAALLRRVPHMDVSPEDELLAGRELRVELYCDRTPARPGEEAQDITVELPSGQAEVVLQVWLALSSHFAGDALVGEVIVSRDAPASSRAVFELAVSPDPPSGPGRITAIFHHEGRPCGQVTRSLAIGKPGDGERPAGSDEPPSRPPRLVVHDSVKRADLTIEIKATDCSEQEFACRVITDLLPDRVDPSPTTWRLNSRAPELVAGYMDGFTEEGLSDGERISRLRGTGIALWKAAPAEVRKVFWELIDAGKAPHSIFVATDEWSFPWELVVPERGVGARREERDPLGVEFSLGRWVTEEMVSPPQQIVVADSYVFAPAYPPEYALSAAAEEASYVCDHLNGEPIEPGNYDPLDDKFGERGVALAHFVCHGETSTAQSQVLRMENGKKLLSHQIAAMPGLSAALADKRPFVFLNACEVGRSQPALVGVGGFATEFAMAGATCVIAPLWSVEDDVAHALATDLYDEIRGDPAKLPADVLRALRSRAYAGGGADSWAAYCFYGDPLTAVRVP